MQTLLAIETSSPQGSIALMHFGRVQQSLLPEQRQQVKQILPSIEALLQENGLIVSDIDAFVLSKGPGSFTGLRVGLGIIQGLALAQNKPVCAISSLLTCAATAMRELGLEQVFCVNNAYMNEVYSAFYTYEDLQIVKTHDTLEPASKLVFPTQSCTLIGDAYATYGADWQVPENIKVHTPNLYPQAQDLVSIAQNSNNYLPVDEIELAYLRSKSAWQKN